MSDTRPRVQINKVVNLGQLAYEMGTSALCASDTEVVAAEGSGITQVQLQTAVDAHTGQPLMEERNRTTIEDQAAQALDANRTFLAIATPTAAQNAAQAKALTRQMNGVLRLLLNQLDGTD